MADDLENLNLKPLSTIGDAMLALIDHALMHCGQKKMWFLGRRK